MHRRTRVCELSRGHDDARASCRRPCSPAGVCVCALRSGPGPFVYELGLVAHVHGCVRCAVGAGCQEPAAARQAHIQGAYLYVGVSGSPSVRLRDCGSVSVCSHVRISGEAPLEVPRPGVATCGPRSRERARAPPPDGPICKRVARARGQRGRDRGGRIGTDSILGSRPLGDAVRG